MVLIFLTMQREVWSNIRIYYRKSFQIVARCYQEYNNVICNRESNYYHDTVYYSCTRSCVTEDCLFAFVVINIDYCIDATRYYQIGINSIYTLDNRYIQTIGITIDKTLRTRIISVNSERNNFTARGAFSRVYIFVHWRDEFN